MSVAADLLANFGSYSRQQLDQLAQSSWQRAQESNESGIYRQNLVEMKDEQGGVIKDDPIKPLTQETLEGMTPLNDHPKLEPQLTFAAKKLAADKKWQNLHTIGTAPKQVDAACLLLMANQKGLEILSSKPMAEVVAWQNASDDPVLMLTGHVKASQKLLHKTQLNPSDIDLFEVNESFAASVLYYQDQLNISDEKLNVGGGALTLGHPLGATGCLLASRLIQQLQSRDKSNGILAIPGGAGVGVATQLRLC